MAQAEIQPSRLRIFLRSAIPDFLLVLVIAVALTFTVSYGFLSAAGLRGNVLLETGLCALLLVPLFACSWSKRALLPGAIACFLLAIFIIVLLNALGNAELTGNTLNDVEDNYMIFGLVLISVTVLTFLLSRRSLGVFVLLVASLLACGTIQFLYRDWVSEQPGIPAFAVCLAALFAMFIYQTYRSSIRDAKRLKRTSFTAVTISAVLIVGICLALAFIIYYTVVAGLGLSTIHFKPFQDYYQRPVVEYSGVYTEQEVDDPDIMTNRVNEENSETNQEALGGNQADEQAEESSDNPLTGIAQQLQAFDPNSWVEQFEAIGYETIATSALGALALLLLLIVAAVLLKRWWRKHWLVRLANTPYARQAEALYTWIEKRFSRLGIRRAPSQTLLEHALASRHALVAFSRGTDGADFVQATLIYQRVVYGTCNVGSSEVDTLRRYYSAFFENARLYTGRLKWLFMFWRI